MAYNFSKFNQKIKETQDWYARELSSIRTGRASTSFLDPVRVDSYGSEMPITSLATVSAEDAKTVRISPWDNSQTQAIEKAINIANLGVSVVVDGSGLRVIFPELTGERRLQLVKVAKEKLEDARVALRRERGDVSDDLNSKKKDGEMSEDDVVRAKAEMEKLVQEGGRKLEELFEKKEKEIAG
ncbi:MAG TPA: ribosome recycling factor [Candidatus Paceibacterota bacterium]